MGATQTNFEYTGTEPAAVSNARRWAVVWLLFAASLINYLDRATISFALPLISHDLHLGPETKGVLLSAFFWPYMLMQVPMGLMVDRLNLLWVYAAAFALWSLAQGLTGLAGSLVVLILLRILLGIGESIYLPGGIRIVSRLFGPSERGLPSGIFDFGTRTGLVVEGVLLPWLLVHYGWRDTFVLVGLTVDGDSLADSLVRGISVAGGEKEGNGGAVQTRRAAFPAGPPGGPAVAGDSDGI